MCNKNLNVQILDPFLGHSHQSFWDALKSNSIHSVEIYPFGDTNWKLASGLSGYVTVTQQPDVFLCSDYFDIAVFKALNPSFLDVPFICYFHENQFEYPVEANREKGSERDMHYGLINYRNVLVADHVVFNSQWNLKSFVDGVKNFRRRLPAKFRENIDVRKLQKRLSAASIIYPLTHKIELLKSITAESNKKDGPLVVLWNHRWEYDKGTKELIELYHAVVEQDMNVQLVVCGKNHKNSSLGKMLQEISIAKVTVKDWVDDEEAYFKLIKDSDVILSTSKHEFFGLSVLEGIFGGLVPLLPDALSYPELYADIFNKDSFYKDIKDLSVKIDRLSRLKNMGALPKTSLEDVREKFSLSREIAAMDTIINSFQN